MEKMFDFYAIILYNLCEGTDNTINTMGSGMDNPIFSKGVCVLTDYAGRHLELGEGTWKVHIVVDKKREYFRYQFDKIVLTLLSPDRIIEDSAEKDVFHYEKFFNEFFILNTVLQQAYIYVVANWKTLRIRTILANKKQRTKGKVIWTAPK
jgi:hypothetical protein